jgi:2-oxoglutarate ferredoxin oxidoreductase subunit alpha
MKKGRIKVMQGNEACVEAALLAGCRFFAGYPITPASEILEGMARRLPLVDGFCLQAEDEIAAIVAVVGASWGGAKAMTATSGPGFCLMQEGIGLAASVESPCVIVNVQRGGPASGQSTSTAQGDLYQARYGSNGDYSLITLCPSTSQEMFDHTIRAFNLAERFRIPVIILSDEVVAHIREKVFIPEADELERVERKKPTVAPEKFIPFEAGEDDVPPMPAFNTGYKIPVISQAKSLSGNRGNAKEAEANIQRINRKVNAHIAEFADVRTYGDERAETAFVSFGSVSRSARSAVDMAREKGLAIRSVEVKTIWPFPDDLLRTKLEGARRIVVAEMNLGMLVQEVRRVIRRPDVPIELFSKIGGIYPHPQEFLRFLEEKR